MGAKNHVLQQHNHSRVSARFHLATKTVQDKMKAYFELLTGVKEKPKQAIGEHEEVVAGASTMLARLPAKRMHEAAAASTVAMPAQEGGAIKKKPRRALSKGNSVDSNDADILAAMGSEPLPARKGAVKAERRLLKKPASNLECPSGRIAIINARSGIERTYITVCKEGKTRFWAELTAKAHQEHEAIIRYLAKQVSEKGLDKTEAKVLKGKLVTHWPNLDDVN